MILPKMTGVIECKGFGAPEVMVWGEREMPMPRADEMLIKISASGVNRADTMQREGRYPPPEGASDILGMEVSGVVVAKGESIKRFKIGDKICALLSGGGYAAYVAAPEAQCLFVPDNLSMIEAAGVIEAVATVWANVFEAGQLKKGETFLVHGGSSGIGSFAIQMAKTCGAKVLVTAGDERKCKACLDLGADVAINYKENDFVKVIEDATKGCGVDVILDMVGGDYVPRNLSILAPLGRHVSIATQKGRKITIDLREVMQKRLILTGSTLRGRSASEKARLIKAIEKKAWDWIKTGKVKPLISNVLQIKNAAEAHKMMESGTHIGKIVLEVTS